MFEFILILFGLYFPFIFYKTINIAPDFLLLLITIVSFKDNAKHYAVVGFLIGFIKDILIQYSWFGLITLLTFIFSYAINYIAKFNDINIKYLSFILLIFIYFYFYYFFQFSASPFFYIELSFIKTFITIIGYFIINFIFNKRKRFF